jgi:hypothetical protein
MYVDVSVIVDGALDEEVTFHDEILLQQYLADVEADANGDGYHTEVYVVWHDHADGVECECIQYLSDYAPAHSYNVPAVANGDAGSAMLGAVGFLAGLAGTGFIALWVVQRLLWTLTNPDACWGSCY